AADALGGAGEVDDRVHAVERLRERTLAADVADGVLDVDAEGLEGAAVGGLPDEGADGMAGVGEGLGGLGTDEAGGPGQQNLHLLKPPPGRSGTSCTASLPSSRWSGSPGRCPRG